MPSTWSQIIYHIVFSTKLRREWIDEPMSARLYPFLGGIVRDLSGSMWAIGGMADHVHLLVRWKTDESVATLVREVKCRSSRWAHESLEHPGFAWQTGYGVFSVSKSQSDVVKHYIERQKEHHARRDFREELIALLRAHGVDFDEQYLD
jgi:REP element-mobilizing transposase RayT